MEVFKCGCCGAIFEDPDTRREYTGEFWGEAAYEDWDCCPVCWSTDLRVVEEEDEEEENDRGTTAE